MEGPIVNAGECTERPQVLGAEVDSSAGMGLAAKRDPRYARHNPVPMTGRQ